MDRIHDVDLMAESAPATQNLDSGGRAQDRLIINPRLVEAKTELKAILASWALLVVEEARTEFDSNNDILGIAAWIRQHAEFLAAHPAVHDFQQEVEECLAGIIKCLDKGDKHVLVGKFNGESVYAHRDAATVTLPNGEVHRVETLRNDMKRRALGEEGTAKEVAMILNYLHNVKVSAKSIIAMWREDKKARESGRLGELEGLDRSDNGEGPPTFVVDEVLSRVARQQEAQKVS